MGAYSCLGCCCKAGPAFPTSTLAAQKHKSNMQVHGFVQHQQLLRIRSRTPYVPAAVPSTCSSRFGRCSAHSLRAQERSHLHAASTLAAAVAAGNSISLVSFPWLLQRTAGRRLLPPPAATEDASSAGGPLQDSSRGGSSRGRGANRGRGTGRGLGSKRSWEGSKSSSSGSSDRGGVSYGGSQESSWQAQAQHGRGGTTSRGCGGNSSYRGRGGGRLNSAGSSNASSGSVCEFAGTSSSSSSSGTSRGRGSYRGRGRGRGGSNINDSSSWVQQGRSAGNAVSLPVLRSWQAASSQTKSGAITSVCSSVSSAAVCTHSVYGMCTSSLVCCLCQ
jgi:hypothetical protein